MDKYMTPKEYELQNAKGYEGDTYVHEEIKKLVEKFSINLIVETGTYHGATTKRLYEFYDTHKCDIITVEIDKKNYDISFKNLKNLNLSLSFGNSIDYLKNLLPNCKENNILFYLDSHWGAHVPLIDELNLMAENGIKPVIVIHDWKVPGKDFGFDSYNGQDFTFEWIEPSLKKIYGENFKYHYNEKADGGYRGLIYIYPVK